MTFFGGLFHWKFLLLGEISGERILRPQDLKKLLTSYYSPTIKKIKGIHTKNFRPPKIGVWWSIHLGGHFPMTSPCRSRSEIPSLWSRLHLSSCLPTFRPSGGLEGGGYRGYPWNGGGGVSKMLHPIFIPKKNEHSCWKWMVGRWNVTFFYLSPFWGDMLVFGGVEKIIGILTDVLSFFDVLTVELLWDFKCLPFEADSKIFFAILFPSAATSFLNLSSFDVLVHRYVMFHSVLVLLCHLQPLWFGSKRLFCESWGTNLGANRNCHAYPSGPTSMVDMD